MDVFRDIPEGTHFQKKPTFASLCSSRMSSCPKGLLNSILGMPHHLNPFTAHAIQIATWNTKATKAVSWQTIREAELSFQLLLPTSSPFHWELLIWAVVEDSFMVIMNVVPKYCVFIYLLLNLAPEGGSKHPLNKSTFVVYSATLFGASLHYLEQQFPSGVSKYVLCFFIAY